MKSKKKKSLQKIILLSISSNAKTGQMHLRDSLKLISPGTEAAKSLMMAERAISACVQESVNLIGTLY